MTIEEKIFKLHADVNQTYDGNPYSLHLRMTLNFAYVTFNYAINTNFIYDGIEIKDYCVVDMLREKIRIAALMHDTIEDARQTYNDVIKFLKENKLDTNVADIVYACTNEKGRNRSERASEKFYSELRKNKLAVIVKIADRMANMAYSKMMASRMWEVYQKELEHFVFSVLPEESEFKNKVIEKFKEISNINLFE
jgi:(p)ppGpp synthase/HD superfamily hydrolase